MIFEGLSPCLLSGPTAYLGGSSHWQIYPGDHSVRPKRVCPGLEHYQGQTRSWSMGLFFLPKISINAKSLKIENGVSFCV